MSSLVTVSTIENRGKWFIGCDKEITIGGALGAGPPAAGQFDTLSVSGPVSFGGALLAAVLPGYTPVDGDTFALISHASSSGGFAAIGTSGTNLSSVGIYQPGHFALLLRFTDQA